jgi:hypothetical protein
LLQPCRPKRGGKVFELTRTDSGGRDINARIDQLARHPLAWTRQACAKGGGNK